MAGGVRETVERYKPFAAGVAAEFIFSVATLWVKAAFGRGMTNPMVLVVYRQGIASLVLTPVTLMAKRTRLEEITNAGMKGFILVFVGSFIGATAFMNLCYQGLDLGSSSLATAIMNLIPAITFLMAAAIGQERVDIRKVGSIAKILGTAICFGGVITMTFFKGSKLLNQTLNDDLFMLPHSLSSKWVIGALLLMAASCCWSIWLVMQGVFGSGVNFFLRSWCISVKGPLYWVMFMPLGTVITTVLASIFVHEELHIGSFVGGVGIIFGLYVVLWGKTEDTKRGVGPFERKDSAKKVENEDSQLDVENALAVPLLVDAPGYTDSNPSPN